MTEQKLEFPYELKSLDEHEKEELAHLFKDKNDPNEYIRVGPKGYFLYKDYEKIAVDIYNLELRPTDIFVASCLRSGTTWTQELVWLVANNLDFETANSVELTGRYTFLEYSTIYNQKCRKIILETTGDISAAQKLLATIGVPNLDFLKTLQDPRFIKTHLPMSLLPPSVLDVAKVVYIARDPRDVIVSSYYHSKLFKQAFGFSCDFKQFWNAFRKNLYYISPYFEHIKEAWSLRHHPNKLFLFYEDLRKDLPDSIRKVASFLDKELSDADIAALCEHLNIKNFKNNKSVNFDGMKSALAPGESFVRKGETGGWRDYFDNEMCGELKKWIDDNLKDTDLCFPSMQN